MNQTNKKTLKYVAKFLFVSLISLISILGLFFATLFVTFLIYKNDISKTVLLSVNQKINGKISFSDISFTPLRHFPNAALKFRDFTLYESKDISSAVKKNTLLQIKEAYISVNLVDLLSSRINISTVSFEGGKINILMYKDGKTNIEKAINKVEVKKDTSQSNLPKQIKPKQKKETSSVQKNDFSLNVSDFAIIDLILNIENQITKNRISLKLNNFQADLSYDDKQINSSLCIDSIIDSLIINDELILAKNNFSLESELNLNLNSLLISVDEGTCQFESSKFLFNGYFNSKDSGYVDLKIKGSDEDFSLFTIILSEEGMKNLEKGKLWFNASVKGKTFTEFPLVKISFGLKDVYLNNPITKRKIKDLNLTGYYYSGQKMDWSMSELQIENLHASIHDGSVKLSGLIRNFKYPYVDINLFLSSDVTGLDKVFKLGKVSNLKGRIELAERIKGHYDIEKKSFVSQVNTGRLAFNDFGINISKIIAFDKVNGTIKRNNDKWYFNDLSVLYKDTDLLINGEAENLNYLILKTEKDITAKINIKSKIFDLPNFLFFDPYIKRDFPHRILNGEVSTIAKTTTSKILNSKSFPEFDFEIRNLDATIENFLPRIKINSGSFRISENILGFNLKFDNFKTEFLNGKVNFTAEYNTSKYQRYYVKAKINIKHIQISELFYSDKDTIPKSLNGKLTGSFFVELQFPQDSTLLKFIKLTDGDFEYTSAEDTVITKKFNIDLNKIYFNKKSNSNLFATLYTSGKLKADLIQSNSFKFTGPDVNLTVTNGKYEMKSKVARLFGENARGDSYIMIEPFAKVPSYKISYNNVRFSAEKMLSAFQEDPIIEGPLNLTMSLSSYGSEWDSVVSNLDGSIILSGENLILNGMDSDEVIDKFKRSQNFNLVDLGAVVLAGPVGIAVTKGTDFARILVYNKGKTTHITKMVSNWNIKDGVFTINDAAFTTNKNRIAFNGMIGFANSDLDFTIALLNKYGCSIFTQQISGDINSPTIGKVKVFGAFLAPVTNLVDDVLGNDCEVFYNGIVSHPESK